MQKQSLNTSAKYSIVMPCLLKNEELLQLTQSAVYSFESLPEHELIIVDDGSPMYAGYLRDVATTYIRHKENVGFVKSVNDGIRVARGDVVLVTNNDVRAHPNVFDVAQEIFDSHPNVYSVHPRMCFYDESMDIGERVFLTGRERWCQSSHFLINKQINGFYFPEHFVGTGGAYEDWFFWSQVRASGFYTAYTTKTCFQHKDSSTTQVVGEQNKFHAENKELFKQRFGDYPEAYYAKLYPEQMAMPWREEFTKL